MVDGLGDEDFTAFAKYPVQQDGAALACVLPQHADDVLGAVSRITGEAVLTQELWRNHDVGFCLQQQASGTFPGMVWAKFTWGAWWTNDPKLNGTAITILIYLAYFVLRNSMDDARKKARISAVYNIFAFVMMIVFIGILPRMTDSLHPGNGGNPGFNSYDLDNGLRMVFYPAVIGWILVGTWIASLRYRLKALQE